MCCLVSSKNKEIIKKGCNVTAFKYPQKKGLEVPIFHFSEAELSNTCPGNIAVHFCFPLAVEQMTRCLFLDKLEPKAYVSFKNGVMCNCSYFLPKMHAFICIYTQTPGKSTFLSITDANTHFFCQVSFIYSSKPLLSDCCNWTHSVL